MTLDLSTVGSQYPGYDRSWTMRDGILYALVVGAGTSERAFNCDVVEGVDHKVLPTFASTLGERPGLPGGFGDFRRESIVFGGAATRVYGEIPAAGKISVKSCIVDIFDKGRNATVVIETNSYDAESKTLLFTNNYTYFFIGEGGFGGPPGPPKPTGPWGDRAPDLAITYQTLPTQDLFYRLQFPEEGAVHALHQDPAFARRAGFRAPIQSGLCTYGFAGRALLHGLCGSDPARFCSISGRFSSPAYSGEELVTMIWKAESGHAYFRTVSGSSGDIVVDFGEFGYDGTYL